MNARVKFALLAGRLGNIGVFVPLTLVVALGLAILLGLLRYGTSAVDGLARANMLERVEVLMDVEEQRLSDILEEYTFWDIAHSNLVASLDTEWANENIGEYLHDNADMNLVFVIDGEDRPVIAYLDGKQTPLENLFSSLEPLDEAISAARQDMSRPASEIRYLSIGGAGYLLALDTFVPELPGTDSAVGSVMGFARRIDHERVSRLSETYRIPGLSIAMDPRGLPDSRRLDIATHDGAVVLTLSWANQTPANDIRRSMRPYAAVLGFVMTALIFWVFYLEIRNHREREDLLRRMANVDHLTGISNRREFFLMAEKALAIARRANTPISLILIDVDNFKKVNDSLGHTKGDRILMQVSRQLRETLREADVYARYGGDEFIILLPGTGAEDARTLAEKLRAEFAGISREIARGRIICTMSIGVAEYRHGESIERLISRADDALYQAKHAGRDRTVLSSDEPLVFPDTTTSGNF